MRLKILALIMVISLMGNMLTGCAGSESSDEVNFSSFTTTDIEGNAATEYIFKDYDVTMVNVWASWCQYCVEEMPYIEALYKNLDSNVNIVGICMDASGEKATVEKEIEETGVTYTIIVDNDELHDMLDYALSGYPTTFFVDSDGCLIDSVEPILGAPGQDEKTVVDAYSKKIQEALEALDKK